MRRLRQLFCRHLVTYTRVALHHAGPWQYVRDAHVICADCAYVVRTISNVGALSLVSPPEGRE